MSCSHSVDCPLFAQFAMEPALAVWKQHYCDGDFTKCARYQIGLKGSVVPLTLMPNGKMIERKAKTKEELGGTALFNAILKGRASMVKSMFASKMSSVQVISSDGSTPLMAAVSIGNLEIVNILLEAGCNPFKTNDNNINALMVAEKKNFPDCAQVIKNFMEANPELKGQATEATNNIEVEDEIKGVVSFLKKLNPFSR
ncbi:MAG: ankyrin repeat domain-containing protein [Gammaproteobacteria bacterium]|nr:ankyrin repeat domain-containing protein [Gammaproteobacteria bacterium]